MQLSNFNFFIYLIMVFSVFSCTRREEYLEIPDEVLGLKPVYVDTSKMNDYIFSTGPKILITPGKIFKTTNMLFVSDAGKGVHVIDNSDNKNPQKIAFINIPGNVDIAKNGDFLYADCNGYLFTIDISDPLQAKVTSFSNMLSQDRLEPPADLRNKHFAGESRVFYECPDNSKGLIVNWEVDTLHRPECYVSSSSGSWEE